MPRKPTITKKKIQFEVKPAGNREFYWHAVHRNGNILFASETYKRKSGASKSMLNFIAAVVEKDYEVK